MILSAPLAVDPRAPLARANPAAKLGAAAILMLALFLATDPVTPALVLGALAVAIGASGLRTGGLARRAAPLAIAALGVGLFNAFFAAEAGGETILRLGPLHLTTGGALVGLGLALRLVGIALAGIVAVATTDPTDLADSLVQQLRVPHRFAIGALAAFRLAPIFAGEWETIALARRARGVEPGRSPLARLRAFAAQTHALLVGAIRRGLRLATAMDARGFGALPCRTVARPQRLRGADRSLLLLALAVALGATGISLALGTYRPLFG
ncbi:MAG TPA: energy-coupling factor transporter transmembrane component T [Candidatus Limnocylindrales bacterium]|nr:energy-coupling factor transporter transmembrane component T [Candidatus Limnocylindrales bacterium]